MWVGARANSSRRARGRKLRRKSVNDISRFLRCWIGPVKYAVEKLKLFVIDEDGKEHEMEIVRQVLRQAADDPKP